MSNESLKNSKLLIISDRYPHAKDAMSSSFVKSQVDALKSYFKNIYVLSLTPFIPKVLSNYNFMNPRWCRDAYAQDYAYDNVEVYFAKYFNFPLNIISSRKGDLAFNSAYKIIKNKGLEFDLIHAHFTYPSGFVGLKVKNIYKKPFVLTVHEDREWLLEEMSLNNKNFKNIWDNADKIIRVNKKDLNEFRRLGIESSKLLCIPNGFSISLFRTAEAKTPRVKLGLPLDKKILINIAHLEEYKGQKYLIESMKNVLTIRRDVMLYIVGQGSLKHQLQSLINEKGLQDHVILAGGNKSTEEIYRWMNACDVFVLPSLSEGNPTVMFEALGCGKPFVGTNVGGIPEIIVNEKLGILIKQKDIDGLAEAILNSLDTKWDNRYILDYAKQFTWDKIAEGLLEVYDEVLRKG